MDLLLCQIAATGPFLQHAQPVDLQLGYFYRAGDYGFQLRFLLDDTSLPISALVASLLLLATSRFLGSLPASRAWLQSLLRADAGVFVHRGSSSPCSLAATMLFVGWELVG